MTALPTMVQTEETALAPRTTVGGVWLWLARTFWVVMCAAAFIMYGALIPLVLRSQDFGDWTIERSAAVFGLRLDTPAYQTYGLIYFGLKYAAVAVFVGVALYIFWRKSNDWLAILVSATLLILPLTFNLSGSTEAWYTYPTPFWQILEALDQFMNLGGLSLLLTVFFFFPDGRVVPVWMRYLVPIPIVLPLLILTLPDYLPVINSDSYWLVSIIIFLLMFMLVIGAQVYRYRNVSTRAQKAATRLVVSSLVGMGFFNFVFVLLIGWGVPGYLDSPLGALMSSVLSIVTVVLLPLAFGVAMLRDQLWASERVLNRAFVYSALTAILLVVYVLIVGALSELLRTGDNLFITTIATGVVALLFQPLRESLQHSINRFLYGERDEPFQVLNQLGAQLENNLAPETALPLIVETIARTMRIPYAAIGLDTDNGRQLTHFGTAGKPSLALPLRYQNETVGELIVARRAPNENFTPADLQLLTNLARQAGAVAYTARLNAQLQHSRERIIVEREQERRRLRRDLHDGLGPTLASQTLKLDAALELLEGQDAASAGARKILLDVKQQTQNTVADIRRIVYELRPPALDDLGLVGALRAHLGQYNGANGLTITFDAPAEMPPLSAAVQVNAYRIVVEAVTNVVKHAQANACIVRLTANGTLRLEIRDDGVGLEDNLRTGVGIASMRERAEELGGTFRLERSEPHGTNVVAELPLYSERGANG